MIEHTSRYADVETATYRTPDGKTIAYKRRRFLPAGETMRLLVEVTVAEGDRLDTITARTLGDPEQFWQVCDANNAMKPTELTDRPGSKLRVPIPDLR